MIKFEMIDDGTIREYRYRGVLLFKTSKHRAFTRRIREEFIDRVAAMQERIAELEARALLEKRDEFTNDLQIMRRQIDEYKLWRDAIYKRKNQPKPTADELLRESLEAIEEEIELFGHGQTIRDMRGKLRTYFADQESESSEEMDAN